jgi:hypothetical protein
MADLFFYRLRHLTLKENVSENVALKRFGEKGIFKCKNWTQWSQNKKHFFLYFLIFDLLTRFAR